MNGLFKLLRRVFPSRQGRRFSARLEEQLTRTLELVVDAEQLRGVIMGHLVDLYGARRAALLLWDEETGRLQVFINLLMNSIQAMPEGGTLRVSLTKPRRFRIEVEDTGGGMTPEEVERAFDPFYTTKERGTGLGLPICYGIVRGHGGEIARLGGTEAVKVDVRLIAATNKDLEEEVRQGRFREDLFYRLNVFAVRIPPLRERLEDIPLLVEHLAQKHAPLLEVEWAGMAPAALQLLQGYTWPGNVRELENALQAALLMANGCQVEIADLPPSVRGEGTQEVEPPGLAEMVAQLERRVVRQALQAEGFNHTRAAKRLRITRQALLNKIQAYGLEEGG